MMKIWEVLYEMDNGQEFEMMVPAKTEEEAKAAFEYYISRYPVGAERIKTRVVCPAFFEITEMEAIEYSEYVDDMTYDEYLKAKEEGKL